MSIRRGGLDMSSVILIFSIIMGAWLIPFILRDCSRVTEWRAISDMTEDQKRTLLTISNRKQRLLIFFLLPIALLISFYPAARQVNNFVTISICILALLVSFVSDFYSLRAEVKAGLPVSYIQKRKRTQKFMLAFLILSF